MDNASHSPLIPPVSGGRPMDAGENAFSVHTLRPHPDHLTSITKKIILFYTRAMEYT